MNQEKTPATAGFWIPAEWAIHERCWMAWPCRQEAWPTNINLETIRAAYADVAQSIAAFEPVTMVAHPQDADNAAHMLGGAAEVLPLPIDDSWLRDNGPTFLVSDAGECAGIDWQFNAWGNKYHSYSADNAVAGHILQHLQLHRFVAPLVMEGGSFHTDGEGTLLITEQCQLNPNRNPHLSRADIEAYLRNYLGAKKIIWLAGNTYDEETDGHVDNAACFTAAGTVLAMQDDNDALLQENIRRLHNATDAEGRQLRVLTLPRPPICKRDDFAPASYINFYLANGGVIMPSFGIKEDDTAHSIIAEAFPNRKITSVPANVIVAGGGGIHCITQQQPAGN
jgi:agmatine deiminase